MSGFRDSDPGLIIGALEDAAAFRRQAGDWCDDCGKQPEGQECAGHDSDGATARAYDELAGRLQIRVDAKPAAEAESFADQVLGYEVDSADLAGPADLEAGQ